MTDAYQEYIEKRRANQVEEPKSPTIDAIMDRDAAEGLLLLISDHISKYTMTVQAMLVRGARQIAAALDAEESTKEDTDGN